MSVAFTPFGVAGLVDVETYEVPEGTSALEFITAKAASKKHVLVPYEGTYVEYDFRATAPLAGVWRLVG